MEKASQTQAVGDDEHGTERHGRAGDHRVERPGRRQRNGGDVVGEGPEEVAPDDGQGPPGQPDRISGYPEVAADQGEISCLDGDVTAGADARAGSPSSRPGPRRRRRSSPDRQVRPGRHEPSGQRHEPGVSR